MLSFIYFSLFFTILEVACHQSARGDVRAAEDIVTLTVYYECLCPFSRRFITKQLYPTYRKLASILDVELIPYGLAEHTHMTEDNEYEYSCQHGPEECRGNMLQACALNLYPQTRDNLPFISCLMEVKNQIESGRRCASQSNLDWNIIKGCSFGRRGNKLLHRMAVKTERLNPLLYIVPWILINGKGDSEMRPDALHNLLGLVCANYKGSSPPSACGK